MGSSLVSKHHGSSWWGWLSKIKEIKITEREPEEKRLSRETRDTHLPVCFMCFMFDHLYFPAVQSKVRAHGMRLSVLSFCSPDLDANQGPSKKKGSTGIPSRQILSLG
jgi:hypothetical protein